MDDILFINNPQAQKQIYQDENNPHGIYPKKFFTLTTDNKPSSQTNYLDMHIHVINTPNNLKKSTKVHDMSLYQLQQLAKKYRVSSRDNKPILINNILKKLKTYHNNTIINKKQIWNTNTYNKTDKFPIQAINFPHYTSNTPKSIHIGSIIGRLHSYSTTNIYLLKDFLQTTKKLFTKLQTQNQYPTSLIKIAIKKFTKKHHTNYPIPPTHLYKLLEKCMGSIN